MTFLLTIVATLLLITSQAAKVTPKLKLSVRAERKNINTGEKKMEPIIPLNQYQIRTLPIPLDAVREPQFIYSHSSNRGTPVVENNGKTLRYFHRRAGTRITGKAVPPASFDSNCRAQLYQDISYDGGYSWSLDEPVINTGDSSIWEFAQVNPYNGEIYLIYVRAGKGRLIRTVKNRTKWCDEITLPFTFNYTSGSFIFLKGIEQCGSHRILAAVPGVYLYYSDDDGINWSKKIKIHATNDWQAPPNMIMNLNSPERSPFMIELNDGTIQLLTRNKKLHHWQFFSKDRGLTWDGGSPTRFYGIFSNTCYKKIKDGRIVHLWLNSIPWYDKETGERVLSGHNTARDILHVAISDDDGKTFRGYREVATDPMRYSAQYTTAPSFDAGQHHQKFQVTKDNKMLVWTGQDDWDIWHESKHRQVIIFDLAWLYETKSNIDFSNGYKGIHTWKLSDDRAAGTNYRARKIGATIIDHPSKKGEKVLELLREDNEKINVVNNKGEKFTYGVLTAHDGAVWNFPTAPAGTVTTQILLRPGFKGAVISLTNGFWNPADPGGDKMAMYSLIIPANGQINRQTTLAKGAWIKLTLKWDKSNIACKVYIDNVLQKQTLPLKNLPSIDGINYIRFRSTADSEDLAGLLIESIAANLAVSYEKKEQQYN